MESSHAGIRLKNPYLRKGRIPNAGTNKSRASPSKLAADYAVPSDRTSRQLVDDTVETSVASNKITLTTRFPATMNATSSHERSSTLAAVRSNPPTGDATTTSTDTNTNTTSTDTDKASCLVIAAADKAGMEGIDRDRINAIILRESGNSAYMQQQRRRDERSNQRIAALRHKVKEHQEAMANASTKNRNNHKNAPTSHSNGSDNKEEQEDDWKRPIREKIDRDMIPGWIQARSGRSTAVVVDMDMFYMACELLSRPDLIHKPACVGGSMITTSNYVARRYGVRSAMAGWIGDKLVEELSNGREKLIHIPNNFQLYKEKSSIVKEVLSEYDPQLRSYSLDEAYLEMRPYLECKLLNPSWTHERVRDKLTRKNDVTSLDDVTSPVIHKACANVNELRVDVGGMSTGILASFSQAECLEMVAETVHEMRLRVYQRTGGLTCSAGIAPNHMLAKIASDVNKPNGQKVVPSYHASVLEFLHPLSIRKVSGIGRVTEKTLKAFGIETVQKLYEERALVHFLFKPATSTFLLRTSVGCSSSDIKDDKTGDEEESSFNSRHGQKGISRERTFAAKTSWTDMNIKLEDIAHVLSSDMKKKDICAHTITVKVKLDSFDTLSKARSMPHGVYIQCAAELTKHAAELFCEIRNGFPAGKHFCVRLLGIRCSNFQNDQEKILTGKEQINMARFLEAAPKFPARAPENATVVAAQRYCSIRFTEGNSHSKQPCSSSSEEGVLTTLDHKRALTTKGTQIISPPKIATSRIVNNVTTVACPVCDRRFPEHANAALNRHVDACLNGRIVRQVLREESQKETSSVRASPLLHRSKPRGTPALTAFFPTSKDCGTKFKMVDRVHKSGG